MYNLGVLLANQWDPPQLDQARSWYEKDQARTWSEKAAKAGHHLALQVLASQGFLP